MKNPAITAHRLLVGIDRREFFVEWQDILELTTGAVWGSEALIRWHLDGRVYSPGEFLPVVEESGLTYELTAHLVEVALTRPRAPNRDGEMPYLTLNVWPSDIEEEGFVTDLMKAVKRFSINPERLILEVIETQPVDPAPFKAAIQALKEKGIKVIADDYGSKFSNIVRLSRYGLAGLKIDRELTAEATKSPVGQLAISNIVDFAKKAEMLLIAEGIETPSELTLLKELRVPLGQGILLAEPTVC